MTFYDNTGVPLAEVAGTAPRAWLLNMFSQAKIRIPLSEFESADYPSGRLHYSDVKVGNLILIEHDRVGPWAGMLAFPQTFDEQSGEVELTAYSGEWVLLYRRTNLNEKPVEGTRGQLFERLIWAANDVPGPGFRTGQLFGSGEVLKKRIYKGASIYDMIVGGLSGERAGNDWGITPGFDNNGRLYFQCHWYGVRGEKRPNFRLEEGHNLQIPGGAALVYEGEIINDIEVRGNKDRAGGARPRDTLQNDASIAEYGYFQKRLSVDATDETEVGDTAVTMLAEQAQPRKRFLVEALDVNNSFDFIHLGDVIPLKLHRAGWLGGILGHETDIRVIGQSFDETEGYLSLTVEESVL